MTTEQALAFVLIAGVVVLLVWGRIRYDVVALLALLAGVFLGLVPAANAFHGFADEIVIIIGSALVVSAGIARSGVVDIMVRPLAPRLSTPGRQVAALGGAVAIMSALMKNIGALVILMPVASQLARRHHTGSHLVLMPMAFASLLGGTMTLIGTSPNIIVSRVRAETTGAPFAMFDYLPVGAGITAAGMTFLTFGWRLLPKQRFGARPAEETFAIEDYTSEMRLPGWSSFVGRRVSDLEAASDQEVRIRGVIRERFRRLIPDPDSSLHEDDILILQGDAPGLQKLIRAAGLRPLGAPKGKPVTSLEVIEAVVLANSPLIGQTIRRSDLRARHDLSVIAVSRGKGGRIRGRLPHLDLGEGDLLLLQAPNVRAMDRLSELGLLPLAERNLQIGRRRPSWVPVAIVAAAMIVLAFQLLPVAVTFLTVAVAMVLTGVLKPTEAQQAIDWPILILVGALIPVSDTLQTTGATELAAGWLAGIAQTLPAAISVALVMGAAMAVTPFLNNAATVLVMAPIGASLAEQLDLNPDAFLMAVAVGAASDFLTPIGHQCNTLVMAPGGYRFEDYPRLGAPLSLLILVLGTWLIVRVWPV